jgi:uncharacterized protein involved in outer membrane biogenesis
MWRVNDLTGRVGDSDLSGQFSVDTGKARPFLKADLRTNSLDFDDLGALFGGSPSVGPARRPRRAEAMHAKLAPSSGCCPTPPWT